MNDRYSVQSVVQNKKILGSWKSLFIIALVSAMSFGGVLFAQANGAITSFDAPDASQTEYSGTVALAIDAAGDVAGVYADANKVIHAYVRSASGQINEFDGTTEPVQATVPIGFDTAGDLAGIYADATGKVHGFIRNASGTIVSVDVPYSGPANGSAAGATIPTFIDAAGDIAGVYTDSNQTPHGFFQLAGGSITTIKDPVSFSGGDVPGVMYVAISQAGVAGTFVDSNGMVHGFVQPTGGTMSVINAPGAGTTSETGTAITAIDASGNVGGLYLDSNGVTHGFVRSTNGSISTFDAPTTGTGSAQSPGIFPFSYPFQFDAAGDLAGVYLDASYVAHGFVRSSSGTITSFDAPDASPIPVSMQKTLARITRHTKIGTRFHAFAQREFRPGGAFKGNVLKAASVDVELPSGIPSAIQGTAGFAISSTGAITGVYTDGKGGIHSFFRSAGGTLTEFNASEAGTGVYQGTVSFAINSSGVVAGAYLDSDSVVHGFVASIGQAKATTTTLTANPTRAVYGQPVSLTAQATSGGAALPDGKTIQFRDGSNTIGSATTANGTATLTTTDLPVGSDAITAVFAGDANYAGSSSSPATVTVGAVTTTTTLSSSQNPATVGQPATFTASVTGAYGGLATGTVTYSDGATTLGSASLNGNFASFTTSSLASGAHSIIATYSGDLNFQGSASAPLSETVNASTIQSLTPAFTLAGGSAFTLTVYGTSFNSSSTVYWGSTALTTTYVSATQLTAQVPATAIASAGITNITVSTPGSGGGTSNTQMFEVDSATSAIAAPLFTSPAATVTAGSAATYQVMLPSTATNVSVSCLNLPTGASCSYSAATKAVTITTSSNTPQNTYQVVVVFHETVSVAAAAGFLFPVFLLPLAFLRKKHNARGFAFAAVLAIGMVVACLATGCGGGNGGGSSQQPPTTTTTVTSSGQVTLTVQ